MIQPRRTLFTIYAALLLATLAVYARTATFDFVNLDDPEYVAANSHVRDGITFDSIKWAFTSGDAANWFPVTRLSHLLDVQFFGLNSGWHHMTSVLIHALAGMLLFAFLYRATHAQWPSALVAFIFVLHPLHVESVAWVAERKDVLCAFFWFLTLWAYVRYVELPGAARYSLVLAAFTLGLMSKPMIVTLPFVLLLLDLWPLRRGLHIREKNPLFVLSAAASVITFLVQRASGAVDPLGIHPLGTRLANGILSCALYLAGTFWPARLGVFYPYPRNFPASEIAIAAAVIAAISLAAFKWFRSRPYLAVGWLWYLGTLIPVIGLVQVGAQARADRYTYVPMVGLAIMVAWGLQDLAAYWPRAKPALVALAAGACLCFAGIAHAQVQYWANSGTLFEHALDAAGESDLAHHNLGNYLAAMPGRVPEAILHYQAALRLNPNSAKTRTDLGTALSTDPARLSDAIEQYRAALAISDSAITRNNLANTLSRIPGRMPEAIEQYQAALLLDPNYADARNNLARAREAGSAESRLEHARSLYQAGNLSEAAAEYEAALRMDPNFAEAHNNLGVALSQIPSRAGEALGHFETAVRLDPNYVDARVNLGIALSGIPGRKSEAIAQFEAALRIKPDPEVQRTLDRLKQLR